MSLLLLAPLRIEAALLARGAPHARVVRTGMGPRRARQAVAADSAGGAGAVAIAGLGGSLSDELAPGDVVLADRVLTRRGDTVRELPGAEILAGQLRRAGLHVHVGPVVSVNHPVLGRARRELEGTGALAVDMESAWLLHCATEGPLALARVISDGPRGTGIALALRRLPRVAGALWRWSELVAPRRLTLAVPRASCAGVERAIDAVERALSLSGPPVYMRRQIVHNRHVVNDLERRGVVCVQELDEVPEGATVVFSAHGVSPAIREQARQRGLNVIDATCPLVSKVHVEARKFRQAGYEIVLVGHRDHEEVQGTVGEAPERIHVIADEAGAATLDIATDAPVAYLTQTTLAVDDTARVVSALRERFPGIVAPRAEDICYATQNRQDGVRALAARCDRMLVVGSPNSSNSNRLVEVARRHGCEARLVDDAAQIDLEWLAGARTIGLSAGASAPERIVQRVLAQLSVLGPLDVDELEVRRERVHFAPPPELRGAATRLRREDPVTATGPDTV